MDSKPNSSDLPHIWWCPTGPLTFLPLHAACQKNKGGIDGTFDYAISSYTPTVNALLQARAKKQEPFNQLVGISMTDTPGLNPLPGADTEVKKIQKLIHQARGAFKVLQNEKATVVGRKQNSVHSPSTGTSYTTACWLC